jgi:anti-sigma factor RsiW
MSCSPFDLKDYFLKELADPQQRQVEAHIKTCPLCSEELAQLRLTEAALFAVRDEEIPQRIAFVSDPVFEPSPWRRALAGFWNSGSRLGFASAAMLSTALVFFAVNRPAPAPVVHVTPAPAPTVAAAAAPPSVSQADIESRIDSAVAKAVAPFEARQARQNREIERVKGDLEGARQRLILAASEYDYNHRIDGASLVSRGVMAPPGVGEPK